MARLLLAFLLLTLCLAGCGGSSSAPVTLVSITVTPAGMSIAPGTTVQFRAIGKYSDNTFRDLTASVAWSSADSTVATISTQGLATAVAAGSTTITATLPIKPVLAGNLPEGYELVNAKTRPDQVTVSGPLQELSDLKFIPTHPIDLRRLTELTVTATDLDFKNLHLATKDQIPILAELDIQPKTVERTLTGIPVLPQGSPARLKPAQVAVTVQGPWPQVKVLKPADIKASVDTTTLGRKRTRLNVAVSLPQGVSLVRVQPGAGSASNLHNPLPASPTCGMTTHPPYC